MSLESFKSAFKAVHGKEFIYDSFLSVYVYLYSQDSKEFIDSMNLGVDIENDSDLIILKALIQSKTGGKNPVKLFAHPKILRAIQNEFLELSEIKDDQKLCSLMNKAGADQFDMELCSKEIRETLVGTQEYIEQYLSE